MGVIAVRDLAQSHARSATDVSSSGCTYRSRGPRTEQSLQYCSRAFCTIFARSILFSFFFGHCLVCSRRVSVACYRHCGQLLTKQPSIREY